MGRAVTAFKELASFASAREDIRIWTIMALNGSGECKVLISFPLHDTEGYHTVYKGISQEEALQQHQRWIKRLVFNMKRKYY